MRESGNLSHHSSQRERLITLPDNYTRITEQHPTTPNVGQRLALLISTMAIDSPSDDTRSNTITNSPHTIDNTEIDKHVARVTDTMGTTPKSNTASSHATIGLA